MDPKKLRKQYMQIMPGLNKATEYIESQLSDLPPSDFSLHTNVKPYSSVKRKMELDGIRDPQELSDLVRGRLFFSEQFDHDDVINIINQLFGKQVGDIDRKKNHSKEYGLEYCGVTHIILNINGIKFELQVMPIEFEPYKEFLHQIYDKFRNPKTLEKLTDKQKEFLRKTHNEMYKKLNNQARDARTPEPSDD